MQILSANLLPWVHPEGDQSCKHAVQFLLELHQESKCQGFWILLLLMNGECEGTMSYRKTVWDVTVQRNACI